MEEQKDLGSYSEDGTADAVSAPSTDSHPYAFLNGNYRNAEAWTNEFMRLHGAKAPDWGNMIGWFVNAIETQHFDEPPSPNPLPTTERTLQDDIRHDRAYLAGLRAGWNLGIVNANDEFNSRVNSLVSELTQASAPTTEGVTQGWQVPDGWKLVPIEPMPEMIGAFWRQKNTGSQEPGRISLDYRSDYDAYAAMIAAAPLPPPPGPPEAQ